MRSLLAVDRRKVYFMRQELLLQRIAYLVHFYPSSHLWCKACRSNYGCITCTHKDFGQQSSYLSKIGSVWIFIHLLHWVLCWLSLPDKFVTNCFFASAMISYYWLSIAFILLLLLLLLLDMLSHIWMYKVQRPNTDGWYTYSYTTFDVDFGIPSSVSWLIMLNYPWWYSQMNTLFTMKLPSFSIISLKSVANHVGSSIIPFVYGVQYMPCPTGGWEHLWSAIA